MNELGDRLQTETKNRILSEICHTFSHFTHIRTHRHTHLPHSPGVRGTDCPREGGGGCVSVWKWNIYWNIYCNSAMLWEWVSEWVIRVLLPFLAIFKHYHGGKDQKNGSLAWWSSSTMFNASEWYDVHAPFNNITVIWREILKKMRIPFSFILDIISCWVSETIVLYIMWLSCDKKINGQVLSHENLTRVSLHIE